VGRVSAALGYTHEKYSTARELLALSEGDLRERLLDAYRSQAHSAADPGRSVPVAIAERIRALHSTMTATPAEADEGSLAASVMAMTDDEVRDAAKALLDIAGWLDRTPPRGA
jgi:hypothetical protein